jgi:hypothetical protein
MTRVLLIALCLPLPSLAGEFRVGFGEADISPEIGKKPVYLAGFGQDRKATGVHDPLTARAVVFADGGEKIAWVSVDVVGLFHPNVESIRKQLPGFKYVMVSSTHNHEGPDTLGLWGPNPFTCGVDPDFLAKVEAGAVAAVKAADQALAPAAAGIGTAAAADLLMDGRLPELKHDTITVLTFTKPGDKKLTGLLVQWNNHPEDLGSKNTEVSADFIGSVVKHLKAKYICPVAYFTGTVGGLMTSLNLPVKDATGQNMPIGFPRIEVYGKLIADRATKAIDAAAPVALTPFVVKSKPLLIPVDNPLYRLAWQVGTLKRDMYLWNNDPTPKEYVAAKDVAKPVGIKSEIGYLKLGDVDVAVIPGEIYPELTLGKVQDPADPGADFPDAPMEPGLYPNMPGKHKMIVGLANDELGYFIPKRQWDEKPPFCYGLKKAQYGEQNSVGPEAAPIICGEFLKLVKSK